MRKLIIAALTFALAGAAQAQPQHDTLVIVPLPEKGPTVFFWMFIERCAKDEKHPHYAYCRSWIDAREEGRKEKKQ